MAAEIDRLTVVFDARFDKLEEKLNKAVRATYGAASKMEKNFDVANQNIASKLGRGFGTAIGNNIKGLATQAGQATTVLQGFGAAGVVAAAGIGALAVAVTQGRAALRFADEISDSAAKVGVSTDALQEYRYAIHAVGGEASDADNALKRFTEVLGQAGSGLSPRALKSFQALGISKDQLKSYADADEALKDVIDRLSALGSEAERQGAAAKLGLSPLLPLLRDGAGSADELRQKAHDLGYVMGSDLVNGAGAANDKLEDLDHIMKVQLASTFVNLAPLILSVTGALADMAQALAHFSQDEGTRQGIELLGAVASGFTHGGMIGASKAAFSKALEQSKRTPPQSALPADFGMDVDDPDAIRAAARAAALKGKGTSLIDQSGSGRSRGARAKALPQDDTAQRLEGINAALAGAARKLLDAQADLTENIEVRAELERKTADEEATQAIARLNKQKADLADDKGFKGDKDRAQAELDLAIAAEQSAATAKQEAITRKAALALEDRQIEVYQATVEAQIDALQVEANIATTAAAREKIEKRILDLRQQLERDLKETQIDRDLKSGALSPAQAASEKAALGVTQGAAQSQFSADHKTPLQQYIDSISDADTAMQNFAVHGVQQVTDALADAITGATSFKQAFRQVIASLLAEITRINLNSAVAKGFGGGFNLGSLGSLFGGGGGSGLSSFLQGAAASNPFLFADGTDSAPGGLSIVGERGPELLNLPRGAQVIPNDILRGLSRGGSTSNNHSQTFNMHVYPAPGMTMADARRTGTMIAATAQRRMATARRAGFG